VSSNGLVFSEDWLPFAARLFLGAFISETLVLCGGSTTFFSADSAFGNGLVSDKCFTRVVGEGGWRQFSGMPRRAMGAALAVTNFTQRRQKGEETFFIIGKIAKLKLSRVKGSGIYFYDLYTYNTSFLIILVCKYQDILSGLSKIIPTKLHSKQHKQQWLASARMFRFEVASSE
jgi:hypothetical protein